MKQEPSLSAFCAILLCIGVIELKTYSRPITSYCLLSAPQPNGLRNE